MLDNRGMVSHLSRAGSTASFLVCLSISMAEDFSQQVQVILGIRVNVSWQSPKGLAHSSWCAQWVAPCVLNEVIATSNSLGKQLLQCVLLISLRSGCHLVPPTC